MYSFIQHYKGLGLDMSFKKHGICTFIVLVFMFPISSRIMAQEATNVHIVKQGETLFRIALQYGLTTNELAERNGITDTWTIYTGQTLIISESDETAPLTITEPSSETPPLPTTSHTVTRGESLRKIADTYGTSVAELIQLNQLTNPNVIFPGQVLIVSGEPVEVAPTSTPDPMAPATEQELANVAEVSEAPASTISHVVQRGERLSGIANRYGVTWATIAGYNNLTNPDQIFAGQTLLIPTEGDLSSQVAGATPSAIINNGREIVVDLSNSTAYAFENGTLVYQSVGSMGLPATPTVQGQFSVYSKIRSQTMSGPGYYLPNVEWVMYFYQGYALHGAYWHTNFGNPMSHGCVNLTNEAAEWFYNFASVGTPVTVIY